MNTDLNLASWLPATVGFSERRPLTKGHRGLRVTHFPSRKNQMAISCAYLQHVEFCVLLEFDRRIIRYSSRPCALEFKDSSRRYCPDFCAVFNDNRIVFYEISKPVRIVSAHEERRLADLRQQFGVAGVLFERVTLAQLGPAEKILNLKHLYHQSLRSSAGGVDQVLATVAKLAPSIPTVRDLILLGHTPSDIAQAVFCQAVRVDLERRFELNTRVGVA